MWWVVLLQGIAAIIIGVLMFTDTVDALVTLTIFLGVYWFIGGIFDLVRMFMDHTNWGWKLASGILGIIAGLIVIRHPLWTAVLLPATLVWILGFLGLIIGVMGVFQAFRGAGWGTGILGVLSVLLGLVLLFGNTFLAAVVLVYMAAGLAIVGGIAAIFLSFQIKGQHA
jgi:uncharacterized membrane protein HdeD (DUF308 family)